MATRFSAALTSGLITRRDLSKAELAAALAALESESCTRDLASGTYGVTKRACQVLSMKKGKGKGKGKGQGKGKDEDNGTATCTDCFVYKRAKKPDRLPPEEATLQEALTRALGRAGAHGYAHIPHFIRSRPDPSPRLRRDVLLFMADIKPLSLGATLWQLASGPAARTVSEEAWAAMWLQIVGTLADLRDAVPGFQHNDLHPNNILLSPGTLHTCTWRRPGGGRLQLDSPLARASIIDFGLTSSTARPHDTGTDTAAFADCVLIDVHHAAAEIYAHWMQASLRAGNTTAAAHTAWLPPWFHAWTQWLYRWLGTSPFYWSAWDDYFYPADADVIARLRERSDALVHGVRDLLDDPYFDRFSARGATPRRDLPAEFAPAATKVKVTTKVTTKVKAKATTKATAKAKAKKLKSPTRVSADAKMRGKVKAKSKVSRRKPKTHKH